MGKLKQIFTTMALFAIAGTSLLLLVSAATVQNLLFEAEDASLTLVKQDESASQGSYIEFSAATVIEKNPADAYQQQNISYVSLEGNDGNSGTQNSPFKTIQKAVDNAQNDTLIRIQPGTYNQDINIDGKTNITLVGDSTISEKPHIIGSAYNVLHITNASYITIDNLKIEGTTKQGEDYNWGSPIGVNANYFGGDVHHIAIRNNELIGVESSPLGIQLYNKETPSEGYVLDYFTIEDNEIHGKDNQYLASKFKGGGSGISMFMLKQLDSKPGPHNILRRNFIYQISQTVPSTFINRDVPTDGNGIIFDLNNVHNYQARSDVYLNVVVDVGGSGMHAYESGQEINFYNNTIVNYGLVLANTAGIGTSSTKQRAWNNVIIGGTKKHPSISGQAGVGKNIGFATAGGSHSSSQDPMLSNVASPYVISKFVPSDGSPTLSGADAAFDSINSPTTDYFGNSMSVPWFGAIGPN